VYKKIDMSEAEVAATISSFLADFPPGLVHVDTVQLSRNGVRQRCAMPQPQPQPLLRWVADRRGAPRARCGLVLTCPPRDPSPPSPRPLQLPAGDRRARGVRGVHGHQAGEGRARAAAKAGARAAPQCCLPQAGEPACASSPSRLPAAPLPRLQARDMVADVNAFHETVWTEALQVAERSQVRRRVGDAARCRGGGGGRPSPPRRRSRLTHVTA
jgi:hypothetical protein